MFHFINAILEQVKQEQEKQKGNGTGTYHITDTRGNKDYLGMIASQIGKRLNQAKRIWRQMNVLMLQKKQNSK